MFINKSRQSFGLGDILLGQNLTCHLSCHYAEAHQLQVILELFFILSGGLVLQDSEGATLLGSAAVYLCPDGQFLESTELEAPGEFDSLS